MRTFALSLSLCGVLALVGCNNTPSGGPGASATPQSSSNARADADNIFKLNLPTLTTSLKQGERKEIEIDITRGKTFTQDVNVKLTPVDGLKFEPAMATIKPSDKNVKINIEAMDNAPVGPKEVKVTGIPKSGTETSETFKVDIGAK
jgi:uncharacterized membrane protein